MFRQFLGSDIEYTLMIVPLADAVASCKETVPHDEKKSYIMHHLF